MVAKTLDQKYPQKSLALDFKVSPKRLNYNLHNVLGFYMTFVMLFIVITGLCMSMKWFHSGVYWLTSGGKQLKEFKAPYLIPLR